MAQQTAVEWLQERYERRSIYDESIFIEEFEQAKAMEKEHLEDCWNVAYQAGMSEGNSISEENWHTLEQYYNETYGK